MAAASDDKTGDKDWRKAVPQSYRSAEVREVSKVLAALEPGATSVSKLMLAMRFEDAIFQQADSLADYRKRLAKRLKKVQKSYKPPPAESAEQSIQAREEQLEKELRQTYGEALEFIVKNSSEAVRIMAEKGGDERAAQLKQHTDNAEQWAVDLGIVEGKDGKRKGAHREGGYMERLKIFIEQRVDNIRGHVVKLVKPDIFLGETLAKMESDMNDLTSHKLSVATRMALGKAHTSGNVSSSVPTTAVEIKLLLERSLSSVPTPRPGQDNDMQQASLAYIDRIRSASLLTIALSASDIKKQVIPANTVKKAHDAVLEGIEFLEKNYLGKGDTKREISLEDAWTRLLEYKDESSNLSHIDAHSLTSPHAEGIPPNAKKQKLSVALGTRVLLTPGRKAPSNLLPAFEAKRAQLIRCGDTGVGARLRLTFGTAFEIIVFLQPLFVTILPYKPEGIAGNNFVCSISSDLPVWQSASARLIGDRECSLFGVTGTVSSLRPLVVKQLNLASHRATSVLRKCFADLVGPSYDLSRSDFEVEIAEATALLKFLKIARETHPECSDDIG